MNDGPKVATRREVMVGIGGVAAAAALAGCGRGGASVEAEMDTTSEAGTRMPVVYLPHGGGPWPFVDMGLDMRELEPLADYLRGVSELPRVVPKALLVVSAHWEERVPTLMTAERPPMLYDYYGFPEASYAITWPAPGAPAVAARAAELLSAAGFESASDPARGFDHGTFVPLKLAYPSAAIPTVQLSLQVGLDPATHLALGRALEPLRDEGVFIIGSGMSFHNMRAFRSGGGRAEAAAFDEWLHAAVRGTVGARDQALTAWTAAPGARAAHPREEHLLPLMVVAGAAGSDRGAVTFSGPVMGFPVSAVQFG